MRNKIDHSLPPDQLFLDPIGDKGMTFLEDPAFIWRHHQPALIEGFAASAHDEMNLRIDRFVRFSKAQRSFPRPIVVNSVPVLLEPASFRKSYSLAGGKCLLNGASGMRLINRHMWENEQQETPPDDAIAAYFLRLQMRNLGRKLPTLSGPLPRGLDFAIESRNTFNFFHFITETLGQLGHAQKLGLSGNIRIHFPNNEEKTRHFTTGFIRALYPELADCVAFERAPKEYDRVVSVFNFMNALYQLPPDMTGGLQALAPDSEVWTGARLSANAHAMLTMNAIDASLFDLRDRGLAAISACDSSALPRRVYVKRSASFARNRAPQGEEELVDLLSAFGFATVVLEELPPLDQIALVANADVLVSVHGAGFANMIFAKPGALMVELGTLQTARYRWGDFWPLAHVSGCNYVSFFADYNAKDPLTDPKFGEDGIVPVALSRDGLGTVMAYLAAWLGHTPKIARPHDLVAVLDQLLRTNQLDAALRLLDAHAEMVRSSADLCLSRADLHRRRNEWASEIMAIHQAWEADTSRWQTLVQMIWCARKCKRADLQSWALRQLEEDFPERCAEFVKDKPWLRALL